jgi:VanZ family protein
MKTLILPALCLAVLCVILTLGLWPFHAPANEVTWLENQNGLHFGRHATVISSGAFPVANALDNPDVSLEIWFQPNRIWDSGAVLTFYDPVHQTHFSLYQSQLDILLRNGQDPAITPALFLRKVFRQARLVFLTIVSDGHGVVLYIGGAPVAAEPRFSLSSSDFTGRLIVGDSVGQTRSWSGQLRGLAIYHRRLTAKQVLDNYNSWKQTGRPEMAQDESNTALYLFDEHSGNVIRDKSRSHVDLYIPEKYQVMDKVAMEPFWKEFSMSRSFWSAVLKNVVGFIPLGFIFYAYVVTLRSITRPALVTVALGTLVSLTIEILQAFLPTRESGTTDLITNTLGTWVGVLSYQLLTPALTQFFPWLPFLPRASEESVPVSEPG